MKKAKVIIFLILTLSPPVMAQDGGNKRNIKIGIEFGANEYWGETVSSDRIRGNNSVSYSDRYYYDDYYGLYKSSQKMNVSYVGAKSEIFFLRNRLGIAAGLRVSKYSAAMRINNDYVLWVLDRNDLVTDYVKIRNLEQNSYYLGVPLELRFFPNRRELPFQLYFKIGAVLNCRVATVNQVDFVNNAMERYEDEVDRQMANPSTFSAYIYPAIGFKISRYPWINMEVHLGNVMLQTYSFVETDAGLGFQFSVQIPLGKNYPMGSK
ncbi:MAG: hypothetical protein LBJ47_03450 [Tannerella sp.]|jgi:hypothetical protein|nr:hypothetical protein [Tannerella sp.]